MLASLPFLAALLLFLRAFRISGDLRIAWIHSSLLWAAIAVVGVEVLSTLDAVTRSGLAILWSIVIAAVALDLSRRGAPPRVSLRPLAPTLTHQVLLASVSFLAVATLLVAITAPPNSWDSMVYHMARVAHWADVGNVRHYPTQVPKQLGLGPAAEYLVLHFQVLVGSDRLANLPQFVAWLGTGIAVSLFARKLGAPRAVQTSACVFAVTLPTAVLQASGSKNDLVVAYFTICAALSLMELAQEHSGRWQSAARLGTALGLAVLTKTTSLLLGGPALAVLAIHALYRRGSRATIPLAAAALVGSILVAPHLGRNWRTFGDPLGSPGTYETMSNKALEPKFVASIFIRNLATQLATPWEALNRELIYLPSLTVHHWLGVRASDPRSTHVPWMPFKVEWAHFHEDASGNPLHTAITVVLLVAAPFVGRFRRRWLAFALALAGVCGTLLFSTLINWQPWSPRYTAVSFALWSAPLCWLAWELGGSRATAALSAVLLLGAVPYCAYNQARPLVGDRNVFAVPRERQYFTYAEALRPDVTSALRVAIPADRPPPQAIGLLLQGQWEYPLWPLARNHAGQPVSFRACNDFAWPLEGKVVVPHAEKPCPELAIAIYRDRGSAAGPTVLEDSAGNRWTRIHNYPSVSVFQRQDP